MEKIKEDMKTENIKLEPVITCGKNQDIKEIAKKLKENKERRIFVIDDQGFLVGIITTTDIVYKALGEDEEKVKAQDIMEKKVKHIDLNDDLDKALEIMNELKTFVCPVTENGKLLGEIYYKDIINHVLTSINKD